MPEPGENIVLGPWIKGVDYSRPASEQDGSTLYAAQNIRIGNAGQANKRGGSAPINAAALTGSSSSVTALGRQKFSASSEKNFAIVGAKFWENPENASPSDRTSTNTITAGDDNTWETTNAGGTLIGHDGVAGDTLLKWAASGNISALDVDARFTTAKHVEWWDRRAWWSYLSSGKNRLWWSDQDDVETYGSLNFFTFDEDVTGHKRRINGLAVHTQNALYSIVPTFDTTTPYRRAYIELTHDGMGGSLSGRCIANIPDIGQVFIRADGIFALTDADQIVKISDKLDGSRYWNNINTSRLPYAFCQTYPALSECHFWLPYGTTQTAMNHVMILNWKLSRIAGEYVWYGPDTALSRNCGGLISNVPHWGGFDGNVYQGNTGDTDDIGATNQDIDGWFQTSTPPPYGGKVDCRWKSCRVFFQNLGNWDIEVQEDSPDIAATSHTINMGTVGDGIETAFAIEVSPISGDADQGYADRDLSGASPFKQFRVRNGNSGEPFSIRRIIPTFAPVGAVTRDVSGVH